MKYLPNQFLDEKQIEAKENALDIDENKKLKFSDRTEDYAKAQEMQNEIVRLSIVINDNFKALGKQSF